MSATATRPRYTDAAARVAARWSVRWRSLRWLEVVMVAAITILVVYLVIVAIRLRVDYFDSYQSLLNARTIVHGGDGEYTIVRHIFYPMLLTPIFLLDKIGGAELAEFVAAHILAVVFFALFIYVSFRLFRLHLARPWALAGAVLLSWNVLLINNAPLAKEDIPGALFATAAFFFYLRGRESVRWRAYLLAGVMMGAAMGTRYNLAPFLLLVIGSYEVIALIRRNGLDRWKWPDRRIVLMKAISLFVLPVVLLFLFPMIVYPVVNYASIADAPVQFVKDIMAVMNVANTMAKVFNEDTIRNYRFLVESVTWPLIFCAALGAAASVRSRQSGSLFYLLWFVVFFGGMTYLVSHKEARFLFAALPPVYFFVARGLQALADFVHVTPRLPMRGAVGAGAMAAVLLLPAGNATAAGARFADSVYASDYERQVSQYAARLTNGAVYWVGPSYPLHPRDYVFDPDDPYTYMYHDFAHVTSYWMHRPVTWLSGIQVAPSDAAGPLVVGPGIGNLVADGSVLIVNPAPQPYVTATVPPSLPALVVEQVKTLTYTATMPAGAPTQAFASAAAPGTIQVSRQGSDYVIDGTGLADGWFELDVATEAEALQTLGVVNVTGGIFKGVVANAAWPASGAYKVVLLYFGLALAFPSSGSQP
jgi:hypothetical protein